MFIKYILLPDVSKDAKIGYVVLHPKKAALALEVFDSQHEVLIVEYTYQLHAIPASTAAREMSKEEETSARGQSQIAEEGQVGPGGQKSTK